MNEKHICCICNEEFIGFGNNPWPLKEDGLCCDECNMKVIEARLENLKEREKADNMNDLRASLITGKLEDLTSDLEESEVLSIIVMLLEFYTYKFKKDFTSTLNLVKKGYNKYIEILKESD